MAWHNPFAEEDDEPPGNTREELVQLVEAQRNLIISVGTGGPSIGTVDAVYKRRRAKLMKGRPRFGLNEPFKWGSLWDWYGHYSSQLPTYASRRAYVNELVQPVLDQLLASGGQVVDFGTVPRTWGDLEARVAGMNGRIEAAASLDDFQDVGRRCREILRDAANLSYDPSMVPEGQEPPGDADVKGKVDVVLASRLPGSGHADLRKLARHAYAFANSATHSMSTGRIEAMASAQATVLIVRVLGEIWSADTDRDDQVPF